MTVYEALKICGSTLETLEKLGVRASDCKYVEMFEGMAEASDRGEKLSYTAKVLAERYAVSERTVWDVWRRLGSDCKGFSAGGKEE